MIPVARRFMQATRPPLQDHSISSSFAPRETFSKTSLLLLRPREKTYPSNSYPVHYQREFTYVKDNAYRFRTATSVSRKQHRKLCSRLRHGYGGKAQFKQTAPESQPARRNLGEGGTGTFQRMIAENGSVTMDLDLDRLNGINSVGGRPTTLHFAAAANSFFPILVFNDQLRGPEPGSMALIAEAQPVPQLPAALVASLKQLVIEKLSPEAPFDLGCARRQDWIHVF